MYGFRLATGYTAPTGDAVTLALGGPGPQVYRTRWLGRPWRPADFNLPGGYRTPGGDGANFALRELVGDYVPPIVAQPEPDPAGFDLASGYAAPDGAAVDFRLDAGGALAPDPVEHLGSGLDVITGGGWGRAKPRGTRSRIGYGPRPSRDAEQRIGFARPVAVDRDRAVIPWGELDERDAQGRRIGWDAKPVRERQSAIPWESLAPRDRRGRQAWIWTIARDDQPNRQPWIDPPAIDQVRRYPHDHVDTAGPLRNTHATLDGYDGLLLSDLPWFLETGYTAPGADAVAFGLTDDGYEPPVLTAPESDETLPNVRIQPSDQVSGGGWLARMPRPDNEHRLPWGPRGSRDTPGIDLDYEQEPPEDTDEPPPLPPEKRIYLLMPSIEAKRVSDGAVVMVNAASVRTDRDSWAWECDLTLARAADRDLIKPTSSGPVEIELTINGRAWRFLVERHRRSRSAQGSKFTASGRSPSAVLAAPYRTPRTYTYTADRTANQIAVDELANTGWSVNWNTTDWLIPGGVFSYQNLTPLQAIKRVAEAVGAEVSTDPTAKTLSVDPYYNVSPWLRTGTTADKALTEDVTLTIDGEWTPGPGHNAVYVSGKQQGVIVHVVRDNTAQDDEAEMAVDELIVERLAGRERGRQILARAGDRERLPITTMLLPDPEAPGLILPGTLLEVTEEGEAWKGQVMATEVSATRQNATTVRQKIEVDRYHA